MRLWVMVLALMVACAHESSNQSRSYRNTNPSTRQTQQAVQNSGDPKRPPQRWIDTEELLAEHPRHPLVHGFPAHTKEGFVIADEFSEGRVLQEHDLILQVLSSEGQVRDEFIILSEDEYKEHHNDPSFRTRVEQRVAAALGRINAQPDSFHSFSLRAGKNKKIDGEASDLTLHYDPDTLSVKVSQANTGRSIHRKLKFETAQPSGENLCQAVDPMLAGAWASRLRDFIVLRIRFSGKVDTCRQPGDRFEVLQLSHGTE
ncbi:MAG: hypothetical protein IPJ88_09935 [Myxococcales bacterium]|nr:MAG: hypothetical protein IPJ88_09935 [Myxococcales bacterium]